MPDILLKNITKTFDEGRVIAVSEVNLAINEGDYVFILGPSGCGKTTLLRTISGLIQPTFGNILLDGLDVTDNSPQSREIAFVFQDFNIFPISVWENCTYALNVQGYDSDYIIEQGEKALKIVGLEDRADEIPIGWGNGDLQRIGIARAICSGAKILIMDEPLGSLDPKISAEFRWELRNIIKDSNLTAIQVTHNQEEAMAVGDYIIVMRDGRILQQDSPKQLYRFPNSLFVGNFLGGLNILEGYVNHINLPINYSTKIRLGGPKFDVISKEIQFNLDENVIIAVRPEDIYVFPNNYDYEASETNWEEITLFEAKVLEKFLTGKELVYIIELDNGDTLKVVKPEVFKYNLSIGEKIFAGIFTKQDLRIFKYPLNLQKEMDLQ
ncbi:ABC transporter ATP-binding protein [Promethearchaeum syntrophicum]|uniref:ABC transporter ATP-binding protein n=1 Tax=Promethearchaeum syntrophicum TaxID=2594042 RepID=A0A5B9D7R1_9ARCH|nr:ABC transporter ATP-binding protein [Candidatus Prometheoarchaeum syntrophicum]QEE14917.1 Trehalose/maltose import ATP-binding protein MalK [Candidatus Prometheoarchaeum syntrophicum]